MEINRIVLNNNLFRFSLYKKDKSDQYVIFLLGALQDIESVDFFSRKFSNYLNCLTVEVPGTGKTGVLPSNVTIHEQTLMLIEFLQYMEIKRVHVVAFSYATAIAVELCTLWPYVATLSVSGGVPGIPQSGRKATKKMMSAALQSPREFAKVFIESLSMPDCSMIRNRAICKAMEKRIAKLSIDELDSFFENSTRLLVHNYPNLDRINISCNICAAEYDPYATVEIVRSFSDKILNSNFIVIKNSDHFAHLQYPNKMWKLLILLARVDINIKGYLIKLS